jgi:hypothetical protein
MKKVKDHFELKGKVYTAVEIYALLGYYAASNGNHLLTFRDSVSVPSSRVKKSFLDFLTFEQWTSMLS